MKPFKRAILSTIFAASCVSAAWAEGQYWAVVVGVDEYIREGIPKLRYAVADAKLFSQVLQTAVKVPKQNIFLLTSDSVQENSQPKLTNIASQLDDLKALVKPDDTVIFYFAGHGITIGGESYLLTEESDNRNPTTLRLSSLKSREITQLLKNLGVKRGMVIMDACRNSPGATANSLISVPKVSFSSPVMELIFSKIPQKWGVVPKLPSNRDFWNKLVEAQPQAASTSTNLASNRKPLACYFFRFVS